MVFIQILLNKGLSKVEALYTIQGVPFFSKGHRGQQNREVAIIRRIK